EVRTRITDSIGAVAFVDAGYVGEKSFPDFSEQMRVGVGGGLRLRVGLRLSLRRHLHLLFRPSENGRRNDENKEGDDCE
ncbi:hypothetical protein H7D62_016570, partial [Brucella melitensis]|uniref:hypothetical protein n=1 Tax=Brucella melitensis TaxID=29459 RepID=UPI001AA06331